MDAGTRLTRDQLAALAPGDAVTIESGADLGRTRRTAGTVSRRTETGVFVRVQSPRGAIYVREFSLRNGVSAGRGTYAALVDAPASAAAEDRWRGQQRIDALWRAWARNRGDVGALRELHAALGERLHELRPTT
jgi:hypothetical protein